MSNMADHQEYKIGGHSILFPCKPYPSQFSMMDKIIRGIVRSQNCLLESPTGSGKSLALLCSALAWQAAEKKKQEEEIMNLADGQNKVCQCSCHSQSADVSTCHTETTMPAAASTVTATPSTSQTPSAAGDCGDDGIVIDDDSDEDFKQPKKFKDPRKTSVTTKKKRAKLSIEYEGSPSGSPSPSTSTSSPTPAVMARQSDADPRQTPSSSKAGSAAPGSSPPCSHCDCKEGEQGGKARKVPKIFFGTRTHKQVAQIVRELKKTAYHDVAMTILASREHTCIHSQVSRLKNKNEGCENLNKDVGCGFKDRASKFQSQNAIKSMGLHSAWDLEDLVQLMKKKKACPYFLSRGLKDQSDLIICPYNYLVDPLIRDSMEINLKGQIVLLDEAHNIEDSVREAASQSITQEQLQKALSDMDVLIEKGVKIADISKLRQMVHKLDMFLEEQSPLLTQHDFQQSYRMWSGFEITAQLQHLDLGPQKCEQLVSTLSSIKSAEAEERQYAGGQELDTLSSATGSVLEQIFLVLKYLYKDNMKHAEDYRMSVVKSVKFVSVSDLNGSWLSKRNTGGRKTPMDVHTLNFWCMNPAVGFADFENCRSVILTSGTLSPMDSFQSELGLPFPIVMEANHIIKDSQVWVGAVGEGPNKEKLQAVYRNMETFDFQDGLGKLILEVCKKIPKGVLCFLPSYRSLEKLTTRWKMTGLWERLEERKRVLCEPRGSDKEDFELTMQGFYDIIHSCEQNEPIGVDGALFFAVCRGKVSEGMDFADNFARAVITVGIPYPNIKDLQVELKRKYNDKYHNTRNLLSGHLWYEIQAFRALNQALGRCIRHRKDWGALIIVDDRFVKMTRKYANGLSKWVRQKLHVHDDCSSMVGSLSSFTQARLEADAQDTSLDIAGLLHPGHPQHGSYTPTDIWEGTVLNSSQMLSTPLTPASCLPVASAASSPAALPPISTNTQDLRTPLHDVSNVVISASTSSPLPAASVSNTSATKSYRPSTITSFFNKKEVCADDDVIITGVSDGKKQQAATEKLVSSVQTQVHTSLPCSAVAGTLAAPGGVGSAPGTRTGSAAKTAPVVIGTAPGVGSVLGTRTGSAANSTPVVIGTAPGVGSVLGTRTSSAATSNPVMTDTVASKAVIGSPLSQKSASGDAQTVVVSSSTEVTAPLLPSIGDGTNIMFVPVTDSSLQATLLKLPVSSPTQSMLRLPPQFKTAVGAELLLVPPGIQLVMLARTLDEANTFFMKSSQLCSATALSSPSQPALSTVTPTQSNASNTLPAGASKDKNCNSNLRTAPSNTTLKSLLANPIAAGLANRREVPKTIPLAVAPNASSSAAGVKTIIVSPPPKQGHPQATSLLGSAKKGPQVSASSTKTSKKGPQVSASSTKTSKKGPQVSASTKTSKKGPQVSASSTKTSTYQQKGQSSVGTVPQKRAVAMELKKVPPNNSSKPSSTVCTTLPPSSLRTTVSGKNSSSQKSGHSTANSSPSLFGDSPSMSKSSAVQESTPPAKPKVPCKPSSYKIPSPSKMRTRSGSSPVAVAKSSAPGGSPATPKAAAVAKSSESPDAVSPSPQGNTGGTRKSLDAAKSSDSQNAQPVLPGTRVLMKKRLFRNTPSKSKTIEISLPEPETNQPSASRTTNNVCLRTTNGASAMSESEGEISDSVDVRVTSDLAKDSVDDSGEETLERRVRGTKRKSLSLSSSRKEKRRFSYLTDSMDQTQTLTSNMKCAHCGFMLLDSIKDSDFEQREHMPSCLKGMVDLTEPHVLYFRGSTVVDRLSLPASAIGDCRRQQSTGGVEASVQLIRCPGCHDLADLLGAKVTLTDTAAATSTGQMWIFTHMVTMEKSAAETVDVC